MNKLEKIRREIDSIDREMAALYEKRMNLMKDVASYKKENNLLINDLKRENEVIQKNSSYIKSKDLEELYKKFIQFIMDQGKELQKEFLE